MRFHRFGVFLFHHIAHAEDRNPHRDEVDGNRHAWRDEHDDQHGRHEQQANPVPQRIEQGREARGYALLLLGAAELDVREAIAQLITSAETTNAISRPKADSGAR